MTATAAALLDELGAPALPPQRFTVIRMFERLPNGRLVPIDSYARITDLWWRQLGGAGLLVADVSLREFAHLHGGFAVVAEPEQP